VIDLLPADQAQLRIHGNGFLQAQLPNPRYKMHLWFEACPKQKVGTPMHNHNHHFMSWIIWGTLRNIEYRVAPGSDYQPHSAIPRRGKDTRLEAMDCLPCNMELHRTFTFAQNSRYEWPLDEDAFHVSVGVTNWCLTIVERGRVADFEPTVMVPQAMKPDNEFDRYAFPVEAEDAYNYAAVLLREGHIPPQLASGLKNP
jgi:hypothetical protein